MVKTRPEKNSGQYGNWTHNHQDASTEVMCSNPVRAWTFFFQALFSLLLKKCSLLRRLLPYSYSTYVLMLGCKVFRHKKRFHHPWMEYWPIPGRNTGPPHEIPLAFSLDPVAVLHYHLHAKWIPNWRGLAQEWNIITLIRVQTAMFWFMVQNPSNKADSFSSLFNRASL